MTSRKVGRASDDGLALLAISMAAAAFDLTVHSQHCGLSSQAGFSHWSSHFGFWQLVGLAHFQLHSNSSQTGEHFGSGAEQVVWH